MRKDKVRSYLRHVPGKKRRVRVSAYTRTPRRKAPKKKPPTPTKRPVNRALKDAKRMRLEPGTKLSVSKSRGQPTKRGVRAIKKRVRTLVRDMDLLEKKGVRPMVTADITVEKNDGSTKTVEGVALPLPSDMGGRTEAQAYAEKQIQTAAFGVLGEIRGEDEAYGGGEEGEVIFTVDFNVESL